VSLRFEIISHDHALSVLGLELFSLPFADINATFQQKVDLVPAMRFGRYKVFFKTSSATGCYLPDHSHRNGSAVHATYHDPPLVFDLHNDPGESTPLDVDKDLPSGVLDQIHKEYLVRQFLTAHALAIVWW